MLKIPAESQDANNSQKEEYLIKHLLEKISRELTTFFLFNSNKTCIYRAIDFNASPIATTTQVVAREEDSEIPLLNMYS